jgi:hypothetical protein
MARQSVGFSRGVSGYACGSCLSRRAPGELAVVPSRAGQVGRQAPVTGRHRATVGAARHRACDSPPARLARQIHDQPRRPGAHAAAARRPPCRVTIAVAIARPCPRRPRPACGPRAGGGPRPWRSGALGTDPTCISCHSPRSSSALAFHTRVSCKACQGVAIAARLPGYAGPGAPHQWPPAPGDAPSADVTAPTTARPPGSPADQRPAAPRARTAPLPNGRRAA